jgi:uncharacterized pyridoxal phosphate-containing UPF0001 family protein
VHLLSKALFDNIAAVLDRDYPDAAEYFDTLSLGMSADMDAAIAAGSTLVRVGSAIFGSRPPK